MKERLGVLILKPKLWEQARMGIQGQKRQVKANASL